MQNRKLAPDGKHAVLLLVRYVTEFRLEGLYANRLRLPFVPTVGMQFVRGGTNFLWMSTEGELPPPKVESVLYDFDEGDEDRDEGLIVCSFTIDKPLVSSFWGERFEAGEVASTTYANYILPNN